MTTGIHNRKLSNETEDQDRGRSLEGTHTNPDLCISLPSNSTETAPKKKGQWVRTYTRKTILKRFPIFSWAPKYDCECALGDFVAGITCGLTVIPQSLAYAMMAGLPPQYGLYGSVLGSFIYIFFGTCKDVPMGPSAILSLLTFQTVKGLGPEHAILLSFCSGVIEMLMGLFGLGFIIDFVSGPVSSGFASAVAVIIVTSQIKDILGITASGSTFLDMWKNIIENASGTKTWDLVLGMICTFILILMHLLSNLKFCSKQPSTLQNVLNKVFWLLGTSRNAILVILTSSLAYFIHQHSESNTIPFNVIGNIPSGLPQIQPPHFSHGNYTFLDMVSNLGSGIIVVPLVAFLEDIAICKAFGDGSSIDATQEFLAIGASNICNSFAQGFPITGALSRGALNHASGAKTPFTGFYTSLSVILVLLFFTPHLYYIPKAALAAIIIAAVAFMVKVNITKPTWRSKRSDLVPCVVTFIACLLLAVEIGIILGIALNLMVILYHVARPKISCETHLSSKGAQYVMVTPDQCLIFPAAYHVRHSVSKHSPRIDIPVVIDCSHIYAADYSAAKAIRALLLDFAARKQALLFYNLKPSVRAVFEGLKKETIPIFNNEEDIDNLLQANSS